MKEFDFDELDKAVNSLMGDVKQPDTVAAAVPPAPTSTSEASTTVSLPPAAPAPAPSPALPVNNTTPSPEPLTPPARPVVTPNRQGGRFMDVVHPSAGMKSAPSVVPPVPSREGLTVQPPVRAQEVASQPRPVIDIMAPPSAKPQPDLTPAPEVAPVTPPSPAVTAPVEPWVSPFLPDAQVEKRPLGGAPTAPPTADLSQAIAAELSKSSPSAGEAPDAAPEVSTNHEEASHGEVDSNKPDLAANSDTKQGEDEQLSPEATHLPAELDSDLVAIESGHVASLEEPGLGQASRESLASSSHSASTLAGHAMATASITQQYSEQPSTGDESHTPIYDNEAVHQPLAHPAKKKSGWMLVIFIVIILVIGAALGGAAYYFGLI